MRLKDKVTIVTDASREIGAEIVSMFAAEGARVVLAARSMEEMGQLRRSISRQGGEGIYASMDVRSGESMKDMAKTACDAYRAVGMLVSNAGYPMFGYAVDDEDEETEKRYEAIMEANVRGYWHGAGFAAPYMKEGNRGSTISISFVRGHLRLANETAYCAAEGTVKMMTRVLVAELVPYSICVNCTLPGMTQVKVDHWVLPRYGQEIYDEYAGKFRDVYLLGIECNQPLHTIGEPRDIGYTTVYLASEEARLVTGSDIVVDEGLTSLLPEPGVPDMEVSVVPHGKQGPMNR